GEIALEAVREAHALGLKVVVWTANDPKDIARMLELGVDGIISDYPDRLRRVAQDRGMALPAPTPIVP
ncbi:MAG: glycerophosphodiester phosphodiesterase family protein, partial [Burkholderiales bacterium]